MSSLSSTSGPLGAVLDRLGSIQNQGPQSQARTGTHDAPPCQRPANAKNRDANALLSPFHRPATACERAAIGVCASPPYPPMRWQGRREPRARGSGHRSRHELASPAGSLARRSLRFNPSTVPCRLPPARSIQDPTSNTATNRKPAH